jgi:hypothetical protein
MKALLLVPVVALAAGCARPVVRPISSPPPVLRPTVAVAVAPVAARPLPVQSAFVGEGTLEAKGESGKTRLALEKVAISATTTGDVAETTVEHVFRNDANAVLEGTFRFPLPEGAILTGLAMEIDGKLSEGELVERDKARKTYEQVVDQMLDPALLEWENAQTFKLRVFPIEPQKTKRVVLRFVAPLHRTNDGLYFAFRPPASDAALSTERVSVVVDGHKVTASSPRASSGEVLVLINDGSAPDVVTETAKDGAYWFAHVRPSFANAAPVPPKSPIALIVLCDRSRSMLEVRALQTRMLGLLLDKLGESDRFTVITGDVSTRSLGVLRGVDAESKTAARAFVDGLEPDGASDVAGLVGSARDAIAGARSAGLEPVVVYIGDGNATWGETRSSELERLAREATSGASMHVVVLGKSADEQAARALAAGAHGRILRPKTEPDAERATSDILAARGLRRIDDAKLVGADGLEVPSMIPSTIYDGDEVGIAIRAVSGRPAPSEVRLVGMENGKEISQPIALSGARPARHVAQRWAKAKIDLFERDGDAHKDEIVQTSLDHGVMSRYTSFLVLDSEEAYARFQIARKAKESEVARVSGRDLDGDASGASVTPDHLQPGDPEVRIPAPADAQSVVVVFPFGETKTATFEPETGRGGGMWVARFLVDRHTPDGTYEILVRITHKDGRLEILKLPYVVDTQRPNLDVSIAAKAGGAFEIHAKQRLTAEEIEAQAPSTLGTLEERRQRFAHILTDAKRVEVRAPDGQILSLVHVRLGEFVGTWRPIAGFSLERGSKLRVVAVDRALNESVLEADLPR